MIILDISHYYIYVGHRQTHHSKFMAEDTEELQLKDRPTRRRIQRTDQLQENFSTSLQDWKKIVSTFNTVTGPTDNEEKKREILATHRTLKLQAIELKHSLKKHGATSEILDLNEELELVSEQFEFLSIEMETEIRSSRASSIRSRASTPFRQIDTPLPTFTDNPESVHRANLAPDTASSSVPASDASGAMRNNTVDGHTQRPAIDPYMVQSNFTAVNSNTKPIRNDANEDQPITVRTTQLNQTTYDLQQRSQPQTQLDQTTYNPPQHSQPQTHLNQTTYDSPQHTESMTQLNQGQTLQLATSTYIQYRASSSSWRATNLSVKQITMTIYGLITQSTGTEQFTHHQHSIGLPWSHLQHTTCISPQEYRQVRETLAVKDGIAAANHRVSQLILKKDIFILSKRPFSGKPLEFKTWELTNET